MIKTLKNKPNFTSNLNTFLNDNLNSNQLKLDDRNLNNEKNKLLSLKKDSNKKIPANGKDSSISLIKFYATSSPTALFKKFGRIWE